MCLGHFPQLVHQQLHLSQNRTQLLSRHMVKSEKPTVLPNLTLDIGQAGLASGKIE
jgi:hypothetical protein